ncbi:MAG: DUF222 domain-containing protein [Myxococcales bacterium]|nr:DUF222 domain-containing protein [Myxococcales bacterium]
MSEPLSVEEVQALGEHIAEQAVHLDAAMHRLLADLRTFDAAGGWYRQGFGTCAHWLSWRVGWDLGTAREHLRVARALHTLPRVSEALSAGQISYSKTRAITRVATAATETVLLGYAQHCTASQLETVCRKVGVLGADSASRAVRPHDSERYVAHTTTASGMVCVKACLRPDEAALLLQVLQQAAVDCTREPAAASAETSAASEETSAPAERATGASAEVADVSAEAPAPAERSADVSAEAQRSSTTTTTRRPYNRADGLMALVQSYARGSRAERAPVELIVTVPVALLQQSAATTDSATGTSDSTADISATTDLPLAPATFTDRGASLPVALTVESDLALSPQATRRLACDCGLVVANIGATIGAGASIADATPLSVGRKTRTIPAALKRALLLRDRTCRFPGCDHRLFLEGHHLQHWADGGETSLPNVALLCSLHHAYVHERGYRITQSATGALAFEDPQGRAVVPLPPRPAPPLLGWPALRAANAALPCCTTGQCRWRGERVDSWDAAATITRIQRRADAAGATAAPAPSVPTAPLVAAPPASPPSAFPRTPAPPSPPASLSSVADPSARSRRPPPARPVGRPRPPQRHRALGPRRDASHRRRSPLRRPPAAGPPAASVTALVTALVTAPVTAPVTASAVASAEWLAAALGDVEVAETLALQGSPRADAIHQVKIATTSLRWLGSWVVRRVAAPSLRTRSSRRGRASKMPSSLSLSVSTAPRRPPWASATKRST